MYRGPELSGSADSGLFGSSASAILKGDDGRYEDASAAGRGPGAAAGAAAALAAALGDRRGPGRLARRQRPVRAALVHRLADREAVAQPSDRHPQRLAGPRPPAARPVLAAAEHHLVASPGIPGVLPAGAGGGAAVIGGSGLGLYLIAFDSGVELNVVAESLPDIWWRIPVLLLSAAQNAISEEVIMIGYLLSRLDRLGVRPGRAIVLR